MRDIRLQKNRRGFSLIEVLVAVAVLAFGLLALAALQVKLMRAGTESKAQTVALSLAKDKVEELRAFRDITGYQGLDSRAAPACPSGDAECITVGGVNYRRGWIVTRYAYSGAAFVALGNTAAVPANYPTNNEFKRVQVTVQWTDAAGVAQAVTIEDAIGALDPQDSARLAKLSKGVTPRRPRAIISDPALTAGIIPIAIGNNTGTAATNPRPEVAGRNNSQRVVETRFDVLTYSAGAVTGTAVAQTRIETAVIGCTCDIATGGGTPGLRPTFWEGDRYSVPVPASFAPPAGHANLGNNDPPDSRFCDICCRDHHDNSSAAPSRLASTDARFDPRRTIHNHYVAGSIAPGTPATGTLATGRYAESCRVIRVDGIFRVAADTNNDYFNLLETASTSTSPVPSTSATSYYQGFVLDYMNKRYTLNNSSPSYNTPSMGLPAANQAALDVPASIDINATGDFKWLHSRGLYVDYLEPIAISRIDQAKADCAARTPSPCTTTEVSAAVLRLIPFTSINLSELANWTPAASPDDTSQITLTNNDFIGSTTSTDPVRGKVLSGAHPTLGATPTAGSKIFESNSGLALMLDPIDPAEVTPLTDSQAFRIAGTTPPSGGGTYSVTFTPYPFAASSSSYPTLIPTPAATCNFATQGGSRPNPYTCTAATIGVPVSIVVGRYNYQQSTDVGTITCTGASGPVSHALVKNKENINVCKNFAVQAATGGTPGSPAPTDGAMAETTTVTFPSIANGAAITLTMLAQPDTIAPYTCTYTTSPQKFTVSASNCP